MNRNWHLVKTNEQRREGNTARECEPWQQGWERCIKSAAACCMWGSILDLSLPFFMFNSHNNSINQCHQFFHLIKQKHQSSSSPDLGGWVWIGSWVCLTLQLHFWTFSLYSLPADSLVPVEMCRDSQKMTYHFQSWRLYSFSSTNPL